MWKSGIFLRGATNFFSQPLCGISTGFHSPLWMKNYAWFFHKENFHIPQPLWKTFVIEKGIYYFLVAEQESNQRTQPKGGFLQRRPPLETPSYTSRDSVTIIRCASVPTCALPCVATMEAVAAKRRGILKGWCSAQRIKMIMIAGGNHTISNAICS